MSQDLPHHNRLTPNIAPSFCGFRIRVTGIWCSAKYVVDRNQGLWNSLTASKKYDRKYSRYNILNICEKRNFHDSLS